MLKIIGTATIEDINEFKEFLKAPNKLKEFFNPGTEDSVWTKYLYSLQSEIKNINHMMPDYNYNYSTDEYFKRDVLEQVEYNERFNIPYKVIFYKDNVVIIKTANKGFVLPADLFNITLYKNYDNVTLNQIKNKLQIESGVNSLVDTSNALSNITISDIQDKLIEFKDNLSDLNKDADNIKHSNHPELEQLQQEIDKMMTELEKKKTALMEELQIKKNELTTKQKQLELQLFALESEIYSIRCYTGEVIEFIKLREGKQAKTDTPLVIYQKMHFLDEDLGRMISIYDFDFNDVKLFEDFIKVNDDAFNTFCPSDKCISLLRVSRTGKAASMTNTVFGYLEEEYEKYHGKTIGILVRNGDNLYMGWTDDEKVILQDDLFYTPKETVTSSTVENDVNKPITSKEEYVSRYFIFSILQGLIDREQLINLPSKEKINFAENNPYIIFSSADGWLEDNRYGTFDDILRKTQGHYKVGHDIICWEYLKDGVLSSWNSLNNRTFERDRNYSRRTGDVAISSGTITKINVIDEGEDLIRVTYLYGTSEYHTNVDLNDWKGEEDFLNRRLSNGCKIIKTEKIKKQNIFISLLKDNYDYVYNGGRYTPRQREARANFRIYPEEFIDLTYFNSIYVKYLITTRKLGSKEKKDYAQTIKYLNIMMQYLVNREKEEYKYISKYINMDGFEWQVLLTNWKLDHHVSKINDYQAKRFAKWLNSLDL